MGRVRRAAAVLVALALLGTVLAGCRARDGSGAAPGSPDATGTPPAAGSAPGDGGGTTGGTTGGSGPTGGTTGGGAAGDGSGTAGGSSTTGGGTGAGQGGVTGTAAGGAGTADSETGAAGGGTGAAAGRPGARPEGPPALAGALWVMVENSPQARPQSGLDLADWVYEIEAEGGITRFMAGYYSRAAKKIGPIRSVRFYFLHIVKAHGGPIAHAGANADALAMLARDKSYQDLDEIYNAGSWFWRSTDRKMPHNLYTSTDLLLKGARARKYHLQPLPQADPAAQPLPGGEPAARVSIDFPLGYVKVQWRWDATAGRYVRYMNGKPHAMQDGALVYADNVIVLAATHYRTEKSTVATYEEYQRNIGVIGEGEAWFLSGGRAWAGRWQKGAAGEQFSFLVDGLPFPLAPGVTWVSVLPGKKNLAYGE